MKEAGGKLESGWRFEVGASEVGPVSGGVAVLALVDGMPALLAAAGCSREASEMA